MVVSVFERFVQSDCVERLRTAYRMLGLSVGAQMSENEANVIINAYIVMYVQRMNHSTFQPQEFKDTRAKINTYYPTWPNTENKVRQSILADVTGSKRTSWKHFESIGGDR